VVKAILQFEHYTSLHPFGATVLQYAPDDVLKTLSRVSFFTEMICGAVLSLPLVAPQCLRTLALFALSLLQLGFLLHLYLGTFQWVMLTVHLACLPTWAWDRLVSRTGAEPSSCELSTCLESRKWGFILEGIALALLGLVLVSNVNTLPLPGMDAFVTSPYAGKLITRGSTACQVEQMLGCRQVWNMFPFHTDEWSKTGRHMLQGKLADGTEVNLQTGELWEDNIEPIPYQKDTQKVLTSFRWRAYWAWMHDSTDKDEIQHALQFQCFKYNQLGFYLQGSTQALVSVAMYKVSYLVEVFEKLPQSSPKLDDNPQLDKIGSAQCKT